MYSLLKEQRFTVFA